jgi:hypothetical protein
MSVFSRGTDALFDDTIYSRSACNVYPVLRPTAQLYHRPLLDRLRLIARPKEHLPFVLRTLRLTIVSFITQITVDSTHSRSLVVWLTTLPIRSSK